MERSRADSEAVLRLASWRWTQGDRAEAIQTLTEAREAVPEEPAYVVALGAAYEGDDRYLEARDEYLTFVATTPRSALSRTLSYRVDALRGETAAPLVDRLVESNRPLDHGLDPQWVVAVTRFEPSSGDPLLAGVAAAATDLLVRQLRETTFDVLDWELGQAAFLRLGGGTVDWSVATAMGDLFYAAGVVFGSVRPAPGDSVTFVLDVARSGASALVRDSVRMSLADYAGDPTPVAERAFEMLLDAAPGTTPADQFEEGVPTSAETLIAMGEGTVAYLEGDLDGALDVLSSAASQAQSFPPLEDRLADLGALRAFREPALLPLAESILDFARQRSAMTFLLQRSGSEGPMPVTATRHGLGEAFGLDRLGAQVFLEVVVAPGGNP